MSTESENKSTVNDNKNKVKNIYQKLTGLVLLFSAFALLGYEIVIFIHDVIKGGWNGIDSKDIFYALILSTTSVAFVGMHYVVNILIEKEGIEKGKGLTNQDLAVFFSLMANAILLAGLIVVHNKFLGGD